MKIVTANVSEEHLKIIEKLIGEKGLYPSRSELIRVALREFLIKELELLNNIQNLKHKPHEEIENNENIIKIPIEKMDKKITKFKTYKIIKRLDY